MEKNNPNIGKKRNNLSSAEKKNSASSAVKHSSSSTNSDINNRSNKHSVPASADRKKSPSSSSSSSNPPTGNNTNKPSVQLWLKSDVFTFGALQVPPHNRIVFENLKKLVNYAFVKNQQDFPRLRFPTWRHVACDKLGMAPEVAWMYFETYDMLRDLAVPQIGKVFDEVASSNAKKNAVVVVNGGGGGDGDHLPRRDSISSLDSTSSSRDEVWVDVRRFALLLGIQRIHKISLRSSLNMGDEWPSAGQPPSSPRPLQMPHMTSTRSSSVPDAEACLAFFLIYLNDFIDLLLTPISAAAAMMTTAAANANGGSSSTPRSPYLSPSLTLESIESLGFLVGLKLVDPISKTETLLNLHEVATIPSLHAFAGYDPISKTFDYRLFEEWLRASLVPDPFAFPAICALGSTLPWIVAASTSASANEGSLSASSSAPSLSRISLSRVPTSRQLVSNLNLGPRPREKIVHLSGVVKETIARSDDDDYLFQSSLKIHRSRDSAFYLLAPMRAALISKCKNVVVVLGCVETTVHVTACENVTLIACCRRLTVAVSKRCTFHLLTPSSPLVLGFNEDLTFAPYNTSYPELSRHLDLCNIGTTTNRWNKPYVMGAVSAEAETMSWKLLDPADFLTLAIPFEKPSRECEIGGGGDASSSSLPTNSGRNLEIPGGIPEEYKTALDAKVNRYLNLRERLTSEENQAEMTARQMNDLDRVVRGRFLDWMMSNGCHKDLQALAKLEVSNNYDVEC